MSLMGPGALTRIPEDPAEPVGNPELPEEELQSVESVGPMECMDCGFTGLGQDFEISGTVCHRLRCPKCHSYHINFSNAEYNDNCLNAAGMRHLTESWPHLIFVGLSHQKGSVGLAAHSQRI